MTTFAEQFIERMRPWNTGPRVAGKTDLERYLNSIAAMFQPVAELATEEGSDGEPGYVPPYGRIFNPATCPKDALPYLAQYVGVVLPTGGTEAEWRALIEAEAGLERGTRSSVEAAIKRVLGTEPFALQERTEANGTEGAYHFNVIVGTGKATQSLYTAINSVKPAGIWYTIIEGSGLWLQATRKWSEVAAGKKWPEATGNT